MANEHENDDNDDVEKLVQDAVDESKEYRFYKIADYLVDHMLLYRRPDLDHPTPAKTTLSDDSIKVVRALYLSVLLTLQHHGVIARRSVFNNEVVRASLDTAEFSFLALFPEYNSYLSFYVELDDVVRRLLECKPKLDQKETR